MEIMCWILGTVSISVGLWVLIVNWMALVLSMVTRQFHSQVPFAGTLFGVAGLLIMPIKMPHCFFYFVPFALDCGTIMCVAWWLHVVYRYIKSTVRLIGNKDNQKRTQT